MLLEIPPAAGAAVAAGVQGLRMTVMKKHMKFCCEAFAKEAGSGHYPQIAQDDGHWHVNGCCGGGCYVLEDIKFCPFCGSALRITTKG